MPVAPVDLKKVYRDYTASAAPEVVEVPSRRYLMIDGAGDPNTGQDYRDAIAALYPLAHGLRAAVKVATGDAYVVMPLEGLWWAEDMADFDSTDKSGWLWTAMICVPEVVSPEMAAAVLPAVSEQKRLVSGHKARVEAVTEGVAAQLLYVGPFADEGPTIAALHQFIDDAGFRLSGHHHEIYLSDPRRTQAAKLRTIIRQPFSRDA